MRKAKKKEMIQMNLVIKQKHTHRFRKWTYDYGEGRGQEHTAIFKYWPG